MRKTQTVIGVIIGSLLAGILIPDSAQAKISGTPHDFGEDMCAFCHTPTTTAPVDLPLWNDQAPADASFTMYGSPAIAIETGGQPHGVSLVCLGCHDGVTSNFNALLKDSGLVGTRALAWGPAAAGRHGLFGRHPISVTYKQTLFPDFNTASAGTVGGLPLFRSFDAGANSNAIECASCHNPHDMTYGRYLRMDNAGSALCLTCHIR